MKKLFLFMSWVMLILSGCADEDIIERIQSLLAGTAPR